MTVHYTLFDNDGRIVRVGGEPSEASALRVAERKGGQILLGARGDIEAQYMLDGALSDRPTIPDLNTVPAGTQVFVDGIDQGVCDDGAVEIETSIAGTYRVRLEPPFPYRQFETDVVIE